MLEPKQEGAAAASRREFIKKSAVAVGGAVASGLGFVPAVHAAGSDEIRVGLIGCGGRGTGAAADVVMAAPNVKLVAMADAFKDRVDASLEELKKDQSIADKIDVPEERRLAGFDAYEKVLASKDVNYVILATPPGFRPMHLKASVAAGKHIFAEKPVAVDAPGVRTCLEVYEQAKAKGLGIAAGTLYRHSTAHRETVSRLHQGAIGNIVAGRVYFNTGPIWVHPRQAGWTDMEYQMRNWYYFTWLSGDHIVEQHVHNLDKANWILQGHPLRCISLGGRQVRTAPEYGHIYDHFCTDYEYDKGARLMSMCRQMPKCENNVSDAYVGSQGSCLIVPFRKLSITGKVNWTFEGEENKPYIAEHTNLIESIRAGKPINELKNVTESTLTAIMGRMAAYTGKLVTWEHAMNSEENLMPPSFDWNAPLPTPPVAIPGQTELR